MSIDMVQYLSVEIDTVGLLEQYLKLAISTALESQQELAVKIVDLKEEYLNPKLPSAVCTYNHFPVILISGWYANGNDKGEHSYFNGYKPWKTFKGQFATNYAIDYVKVLLDKNDFVWKHEFIKKFGDGYNDDFNHCDGSVGVGYELKSCACFPEVLAISLKHIYYGK